MDTSAFNLPDPNKRQVGGTHYAKKYQHWDFAADCKLGYFEGQITKYLERHKSKNKVQDVDKALHFAEKLYSLAVSGKFHQAFGSFELMEKFAAERDLSPNEFTAIWKAVSWRFLGDLDDLISAVKAVKLQFYGE